MTDHHKKTDLKNWAETIGRGSLRPFKSNNDLLYTASRLFELRQLTDKDIPALDKKVSSVFHQRLILSSKKLRIAKVLAKHKLNRMEKELLLILTAGRTGVYPKPLATAEILKALSKTGMATLPLLMNMSQSSRLSRLGLVDVEPGSTRCQISYDFAAEIIGKEASKSCEELGQTSVLARKPTMRPEQLVVTDAVRDTLKMCVAQAKHAKILFDTWGLSKTFSYGTGMTILFSGPPGTGKTACAEALAYELDKPIIVVNHAEVRSRWVGSTEKNIVRIFEEAAKSGTVLFWDEADSMFYNRDLAERDWEIKSINVLLMELEKFKGVCILSTNRLGAMDKALERRIAVKVRFERPEQEQRRLIWEKLLPEDMPITDDVQIEHLSSEDLSGGEIKNVILNAARIGLCRNPEGPVTMDDFVTAIRMEKEGSWNNSNRSFGFAGRRVKELIGQ